MANNPDHQANLKPFKLGDKAREGKFIAGDRMSSRWVVNCTDAEFQQIEKLRKKIAKSTKKNKMSRRAFLLHCLKDDLADLKSEENSAS